MKILGKSLERPDAIAKVTGKAKYVADYPVRNLLVGKILRSNIAHGYITKIDVSKAKALPGVVAIITADDVPDIKFQPTGLPIASYPEPGLNADKNIFTKYVRFYGDEIAAVAAEDELTARKALDLIEVEYKELPVYLKPEDAMADDTVEIHHESKNVLGRNEFTIGEMDVDEAFERCDLVLEDEFMVNSVQHCQMENHIAYAYTDEKERVVIVTSTQIPHIVRRVTAHALGLAVSRVRIIKPYVGGGFGSKTDVCIEAIVASLTLAAGGIPVMIDMEREECMIGTRLRHAIQFKIKTGVNSEGRILAKELISVSNTGAYASHGHDIASKGGGNFFRTYPAELVTHFEGTTAYTNLPPAGAMRAYGIPQVNFAVESHMDDVASALGMDPVVFRKINMIREGFVDPLKRNMVIENIGLEQCLDRAKKIIGWDKKRERYSERQTGDRRQGVGIACFSYGTAVWPYDLEVAGARMMLNPDGTLQLTMGATEIGQGSDAVFCQMASEVIGIAYEQVLIDHINDTDHSPFDTGSYASRQCYVSGQAVKKVGLKIRDQILERVEHLSGIKIEDLDIVEGQIIENGNKRWVASVMDIALKSYCSMELTGVIKSEAHVDIRTTAYAFGASAAEVEVDMKTGRVEILNICNVHDSGTILNPMLAKGQVHGGMSMSLGLGLSEVMLFNDKGKPLNNNLLDYKLPTIMDTPEFGVEFVETFEPTGPFGNKALGEPPAISPAAAVRNAILQATGVKVNQTPMNPQSLFERFSDEGLV